MVINEVLVAAYIYLICSVILTIVALIGNTWTCYIFTRKKFRKVSMFFYLVISNIANLLLILTVWPASLLPEEFKLRSLSFSCKFIPFITFFFLISDHVCFYWAFESILLGAINDPSKNSPSIDDARLHPT